MSIVILWSVFPNLVTYSMHVTNLASDVVPIAAVHANTSFEALFEASHLFSDMALALWSCGSYNELLWN